MKNKKALAAIVSCIIATVFLMYTEPVISDVLVKIGVSEDYIGYIFAASCLSYAVAAPIVGYLINHFQKESLTLFAFLLSSLAIFIQGPSKVIFGSLSSIPMTITGFVFLGSMEAFIFVPLMPLLIDQIKVTFLA